MNEKYIDIDKIDLKFFIKDKEFVVKDVESSKSTLRQVGESPLVTGIKTGKIKCYLQKNVSKYIYNIKLDEGTFSISPVIYNVKKPNLHKNVEIISTCDILGNCTFKIISDGTVKQLFINGVPQEENPCVEFDYYILTDKRGEI